MKKQEFLEKLRIGISALPQRSVEERISFYSEMIDDRLEEGLSEEEAIEELGSADDVIGQILAETPLAQLFKARIKPKHKIKVWEIVLLALGFPIWGSLLIAVAAVLLSLYVVIWSVVISLWAVAVAVTACLLGGIAASVFLFIQGNTSQSLATLGAGLVCGGLGILFIIGCSYLSRGVMLLTKGIFLGTKKALTKKEAEA